MKVLLLFLLALICGWPSLFDSTPGFFKAGEGEGQKELSAGRQTDRFRIATFNVALHRKQKGELNQQLDASQDLKIRQLAEVIQRVRPDVLLLNEVDFDAQGRSVRLFQENFLQVAQNSQSPIQYPYLYVAPVNTGVLSHVDINQDGKVALPDDGFGYGAFPGQYGMALLSRYPIQRNGVRTFQKFLWKDMPKARFPKTEMGSNFFPAQVVDSLRLASKSFWDIPVSVGQNTLHLICAHPTPPVFDGPEDRNGCRNHDEIRMIADYVTNRADYLYDDQGRMGGLAADAKFVVLGDLNADPNDGDSLKGAITQLTECSTVHHEPIPQSHGARVSALESGLKNSEHRGNHVHDTADFNDEFTGNLRVDYCLPSRNLRFVDAGVFWPLPEESGFELNQASDHHLVWVDLSFR